MTWHISAAERVANAKKSRITRQSRGEKSGWAHETPAQRHAAHLKAIETMKAKGEKIGFARLTHEQRVEMALKSAATRKREGIRPFNGKHGHGGWHLTPAQRVQAAHQGTITRAARRKH